jgi:hypothetical protein
MADRFIVASRREGSESAEVQLRRVDPFRGGVGRAGIRARALFFEGPDEVLRREFPVNTIHEVEITTRLVDTPAPTSDPSESQS